MSLEQMTYKMQPAGHEEPSPKRKYSEPDKRLCLAFEKWLDREYITLAEDEYKLAESLIENLTPSVEEAHSLLISYQDDIRLTKLKPFNQGLFISAVYNKSPEKEIIFDLELSRAFGCFAYKLPKEKTFVNLTDIGIWCGQYSKGNLINYGKTGANFGSSSTGVVLDYGRTKSIGNDASLVISLGECELAQNNDVLLYGGTSIQHGGLSFYASFDQPWQKFDQKSRKLQAAPMPRWQKYMAEIKQGLEKGRTDHHAAIDAIKDLNAAKIKADFHRILKEEYDDA